MMMYRARYLKVEHPSALDGEVRREMARIRAAGGTVFDLKIAHDDENGLDTSQAIIVYEMPRPDAA